MQEPIDPSVMIINVEDYPGLDPTTQDGKDQLSAIGFQASHDHPGKNHFLFMHKGEQIGQMITRSMFKIVDGQLRENKPDWHLERIFKCRSPELPQSYRQS